MAFLPHISFELLPVCENVPYKISSLALDGDRVFVAAGNTLLVYKVADADAHSQSNSHRTTLLFTDKKFAKKPISGLQVLQKQQLLLTLSDYLHVHSVRESKMLPVSTVAKSKGAALFTVDASKDEPILCLALKKKLLLLALQRNGEFAELRELALPDTPRMLHFCADNICIGFKREYVMVRAHNGAVSEVCPTGRTGVPLATPLPEQQMLLLRDNIGVFAYYDGRATGRASVSFSEPPVAVAYRFPFVVAAIGRAIEVRGVGGAHGLVQQLPARGVLALAVTTNEGASAEPDAAPADDVALFAASQDCIWRLRPVPLRSQCDRLVRERRFEEALALCDAMPVDTADRADRLREIKRLFAQHLFATAQFDRSLQFFFELRQFPLDVLGLYQDLLPERAAKQWRARQLHEHQKTMELTSAAGGSQMPSTPKFTVQQKIASYKALIGYINRVRGDAVILTAPTGLDGPENVAGESAAASALAAADDYANTTDSRRILDTSLLKSYLEADPSQLMPFLQSSNQCDVLESERLLANADRHAELVQLYFSHGMHRKALDLLSKLAHGRGPLSGFGALIKYLARLSGADAPLVLQYSRHALQAAPNEALAVFCSDRPERERLPRPDVLAHLRQYAPQLVQQYLEFILQKSQWVESRPEFHNDLVSEYLNTVLALKRNQTSKSGSARVPAGSEPGLLGETRSKLLAFLDSSDYYHAETLLSKFPLDDLYEERAVLLAKLGQHEAALSIYVHTLNDISKAEAYCARRYETADGVYLALLRVCVAPPPGAQAKRDVALGLVNRHAARMDSAAALALLDDSTLIGDLATFFSHALRQRDAERRAGSVVANLLQSAHAHARLQLLTVRARAVRIDRTMTCSVCSKRLGASAFALIQRHENERLIEKVVHYYCYSKVEQ